VITALKTMIPFLMAFTAIGLAYVAVRVGLRATPQPDPFSLPVGEMPRFTRAQLRRIERAMPVGMAKYHLPQNSQSAGLALRPDAGSVRLLPTGPDAARIDPTEVFEGCWRCPRG
jgi:hypothetical protein